MRTLLVLCLLSACGSVPEPTGGPCIQVSDCPDGQFCVRGRCSLSADGGTPTGQDRDHDSVADEDDNCPDAANTTQDDEDRDGKGDACDPCPLIANEPAGVCDPAHPTQTEQWLFESFHKDPHWTPAEPGATVWTVGAGDALAITATTLTSARLVLPVHTGTRRYDDFTITTQVTVDARGTTSQLGIAITVPDLVPSELACKLTTDTTRGDRLGFAGLTPDQAYPWTTAKVYRLSLAIHDGKYDCIVRQGSNAATTATVTPATAAYPTSDDGSRLLAEQVTARFDWVYVVGSASKSATQ